MPSIVRGNTITLNAVYLDLLGEPAVPVNPLVDIVNPAGITVVNNDVPAASGGTGEFDYDYAVGSSAPVGTWLIQWHGLVDGNPAYEEEEFSVLANAPTGTALGPCSPWAWELPEACLTELPDDYDPAVVLAVATSTLWRLSGRRIGLCDRTIRPCMEECGQEQWGNGAYLPGSAAPLWGVYDDGVWWPYRAICGACGDSCSCTRLCEIRLLGPVSSITEVSVDGVVLPDNAYRVDDRRTLVRVDGDCWPRCQDLSVAANETGTFVVKYVRGVTPPADAVRAVQDLAFELAKAECGAGGCRLPARLTSIVRQGVTVETMIDDLDFLEKGRTGLYFVDLFLRSVNPKGVTRGARVYRADAREPRVTLG